MVPLQVHRCVIDQVMSLRLDSSVSPRASHEGSRLIELILDNTSPVMLPVHVLIPVLSRSVTTT